MGGNASTTVTWDRLESGPKLPIHCEREIDFTALLRHSLRDPPTTGADLLQTFGLIS
jgi:hypothetical protein